MNVKIGAESAPHRVQREMKKASLAASIGAENSSPMARERELKKAQMLASVGQAYGNGDCIQPIDQKTLMSVLQNQGQPLAVPAGINLDQATLNYIYGLINTSRYCPSPRRTGWQCSTMMFQALAVADQATVAVTVTPTQAFCASALVAASGSSLDYRFTINSLTYNGIDYVTNGPWFSLFYTAAAACCLCVREIPIIEPNTPIVMSLTNDNGSAVDLRVQMFGEELFCG